MVGIMKKRLAFLTFDPSDKMPGILKANLWAINEKVPIINIFDQKTFNKGIEEIAKLRAAA
jgi:hypothetical protein